jgi:hypothetical protein
MSRRVETVAAFTKAEEFQFELGDLLERLHDDKGPAAAAMVAEAALLAARHVMAAQRGTPLPGAAAPHTPVSPGIELRVQLAEASARQAYKQMLALRDARASDLERWREVEALRSQVWEMQVAQKTLNERLTALNGEVTTLHNAVRAFPPPETIAALETETMHAASEAGRHKELAERVRALENSRRVRDQMRAAARARKAPKAVLAALTTAFSADEIDLLVAALLDAKQYLNKLEEGTTNASSTHG